MFRGKDVKQIEELKRQGLSVRAISELTGYDRKTIRRYPVGASATPVYGPRPAAASKLDPFRDYPKERMQAGKETTAAGRRLISSVKQAMAWASGEDVPVRVTMVNIERRLVTDVRTVRQKLRLSQAEFAARFGFAPSTVKNWEQGRTQPDGPARILLAVIAHRPEAVENALRKAS